MNFSKKRIAIFLIMMGLVSLGPKLYFADFIIPDFVDNFDFTLRGLAYSHGDYAESPKQTSGWPLFISPFLLLIRSNNIADYANIVQILSLGISLISILPMYLLARKFFDKKYSLVATTLFAFEPHLNRISGSGLTEPIFILLIITSFCFILTRNSRHVYFSFILAALLWWMRLNGIIMLFALSIIYFVNFRKSNNLIGRYLLCVAIFLIVVSPFLVQRYYQYGDPLYFYYGNSLFVEDYSSLGLNEKATAMNYVKEHGIISFIQKFIISGIYNILQALGKVSFPYLIIILPFGLLFSLRVFDQDKRYIHANWILLLTILTVLVVPFSIISDKRFLYPLLPFLILFSTITINRVTEYGLSTFAFSSKNKNIFLVIVIIIVFVLSTFFLLRYEKSDELEKQEAMNFTKFLVHNLHGKLMDAGYTIDYYPVVQIQESPGIMTTYKMDRSKRPYAGFPYEGGNPTIVRLQEKSVNDLLRDGEGLGLKYISINEQGAVFDKYLNDVYYNEEKYSFLTKIFDPADHGYSKFKVKVFEINYTKFHENKLLK